MGERQLDEHPLLIILKMHLMPHFCFCSCLSFFCCFVDSILNYCLFVPGRMLSYRTHIFEMLKFKQYKLFTSVKCKGRIKGKEHIFFMLVFCYDEQLTLRLLLHKESTQLEFTKITHVFDK